MRPPQSAKERSGAAGCDAAEEDGLPGVERDRVPYRFGDRLGNEGGLATLVVWRFIDGVR